MGLDDAREIIKAERQTCKFYLKIDFGVLAGAVSIFTILKLERIDILKAIVEGKFFITGIIVLICYGLIFDHWLLIKWSLQNLTENQQKSVLKWSKIGTRAQLVLHIFFILSICYHVIGFSTDYSNGYDAGKAMASIVSSIEKYNSEKKSFPKTLEDLISQYPHIYNDVKQLGKTKLHYALDKTRGYILQFAGKDGKLETKDDIIEDRNFFLEKMDFK